VTEDERGGQTPTTATAKEEHDAGRPQPAQRQRAPSRPHAAHQGMDAAAHHRQTAAVMRRETPGEETCRLHFPAYLPMKGGHQSHSPLVIKCRLLVAVSSMDGHRSLLSVTAVTVECRLQAVECRLQRIESLQYQLMTIAQDGNGRRRQRKGVLVGGAATIDVLLIFIAHTSNRRWEKRGRP
jgi:hypothetical protein